MARDYKHRAQGKKTPQRGQGSSQGLSVWKSMLIVALIISFVVFLVYLRLTAPKETDTVKAPQTVSTAPPLKADSLPASKDKKPKQEAKPDTKPKPPHFEFYNILPKKEVVVVDHEIKTRIREERLGKAKESKYIMQAGSFEAFKEADQLKAKLALMGIESKITKTKVGRVTWYRVKIGPYNKMSSVDVIKSRLKKNGVDVVVTETNG